MQSDAAFPWPILYMCSCTAMVSSAYNRSRASVKLIQALPLVCYRLLSRDAASAVAEVLFMKSGSEESDRGARALAGHSMISPGEEVTAIITELKNEWTVQCYRFVTTVFVCFREHPIMELISLFVLFLLL